MNWCSLNSVFIRVIKDENIHTEIWSKTFKDMNKLPLIITHLEKVVTSHRCAARYCFGASMVVVILAPSPLNSECF